MSITNQEIENAILGWVIYTLSPIPLKSLDINFS